MPQDKHKTWKFIGLILLIAIVIMSFFILFKFIDILILALATAYIIYPVAKWLNGGRTDPGNRYLIASFAAALIVGVPIILSIFYSLNFVLQWFIQNLPAVHSGRFLTDLKTGLDALGFNIISTRLASELGKVIANLTTLLSAYVLNPTWLLSVTIKIVLYLITTFYFVYEGPQFRKFIEKNLPQREEFLKELVFSFNRICYSLFVSHFFTAIIVTFMAAIGFWIILRPTIIFLALLSVLVFIGAFLPIVGSWMVYMPLGLWQMFLVPGGYGKGIAVIVFGILFLALLPDLYIRPKLVQKGSEIHPLLFILGFFGGQLLMGLKGIIIGPLILGLAQGIVLLYARKRHILKELVEHF